MEGIILSSWDHIMGPQIEKLWLFNNIFPIKLFTVPDKILHEFNVSKNYKHITNAEDVDLSSMKTYTVMCGQLLLGEVDSCRAFDEWSSRLYVSENKILVAVLFHLNFWKSPSSDKTVKDVCLCFGILFKHHIYSLILYNHLLIDQHLRKAVYALKNSGFSVAAYLKDVTALIEDITKLISSIQAFNTSISIIQLLPPFKSFMKLKILPQAIVSHLQTSGCTAVVGNSKFIVNEIIYLLALFSPQRKSRSFRTVAPQFSKSYIMDAGKNSKFLLERAGKELCSLTVVDLDLWKVWQTSPFQEGFKTEKNSICVINETGCIVPELISDIMFVEENKGDYRQFVENFNQRLMTKSCALIKSIDHSRRCGKFLSKQELMVMFSMQNLVDLEIILGCAENIKPGIKSIVVE